MGVLLQWRASTLSRRVLPPWPRPCTDSAPSVTTSASSSLRHGSPLSPSSGPTAEQGRRKDRLALASKALHAPQRALWTPLGGPVCDVAERPLRTLRFLPGFAVLRRHQRVGTELEHGQPLGKPAILQNRSDTGQDTRGRRHRSCLSTGVVGASLVERGCGSGRRGLLVASLRGDRPAWA